MSPSLELATITELADELIKRSESIVIALRQKDYDDPEQCHITYSCIEGPDVEVVGLANLLMLRSQRQMEAGLEECEDDNE